MDVLRVQHPYARNLTTSSAGRHRALQTYDLIVDHGGECEARPRMCPALRLQRMQALWPALKPGGHYVMANLSAPHEASALSEALQTWLESLIGHLEPASSRHDVAHRVAAFRIKQYWQPPALSYAAALPHALVARKRVASSYGARRTKGTHPSFTAEEQVCGERNSSAEARATNATPRARRLYAQRGRARGAHAVLTQR
jgi:hypothetical protein